MDAQECGADAESQRRQAMRPQVAHQPRLVTHRAGVRASRCAGRMTRARTSECLQDRFGGAHLQLTAFFHGKLGNGPVIHDHREAL